MSSSKNAFAHKTGQHFIFPPSKLVIIGHDTPHVEGQHNLWRADAKTGVPTAEFVDSIRKHGFIQPVRAIKIDEDTAMVVVGRERVKSARIIEKESGKPCLVPTMVFDKNATMAEVMGVANAENYQRKSEDILTVATHVHMQMMAEGINDGVDELTCAKNVSVSTGFSVQRIRNLMVFRSDERLVRAVRAHQNGKPGLGAEAALSIATLAEGDRQAQIDLIIANPDLGTIAQVRERVSHAKHNKKEAEAAAAGNLDSAAVSALAGAMPTSGAATTTAVTKKAPKAGTKAAAKAAAKASKPVEETGYPGLSKATMRRMVSDQMALAPDSRDLSEDFLKFLKACSGMGPPGLVPGLKKVMKDMGF